MSCKMLVPSIPRTVGDEASRNDARNALIDWRRAMPDELRRRADSAIADRLEAVLREEPFSTARVYGAFWAVRGEPDLLERLERLLGTAAAVALPRLSANGRGLEFGRWTPGAAMRADRFGIPVPDPFEPLEPDLLIVPCVGFDVRGYRLGYGGGHYDRTLAARDRPAIGVAYDACQIDRFEAAAHDRALSRIVTETRSIRPR